MTLTERVAQALTDEVLDVDDMTDPPELRARLLAALAHVLAEQEHDVAGMLDCFSLLPPERVKLVRPRTMERIRLAQQEQP
jgi:hypothetical protein